MVFGVVDKTERYGSFERLFLTFCVGPFFFYKGSFAPFGYTCRDHDIMASVFFDKHEA